MNEIFNSTHVRVTKIQISTQNGEPYYGDINHFFVSEEGWDDFVHSLAQHWPQASLTREDEPFVIDGTTAYGRIKILHVQYTLYIEEELA